MALNNYTTIKDAVTSWLSRDGFKDFGDQVENFIIAAQRRIQRELRNPAMEQAVTLTITTGTADIPADMLEVKEMVAYDGSTAWPVVRGTAAEVRRYQLGDGDGPLLFDTVADTFRFGPYPSSGVTVELIYYRELEFITETVAQNWYSRYAPESILYGALVEASVFMRKPELAAGYQQMYQDTMALLVKHQAKAEWSGSGLKVRVA